MRVNRSLGSAVAASALLGAVAFAVAAGPVIAGAALAAAAAANPLTATASPAEVTLTPGGAAAGVLTVANGATAEAPLSVRWVVSDPSVTVLMPQTTAVLGAAASTALDFQLRRTGEGIGQNVSVAFVVSAPQVSAVATVTVKAVANPALVEAKVDSTVDRINENRPGSAALVLSNPRDSAVRVQAVSVTAPTSATVTLRCPDGATVTAAPDSTQAGATCAFQLGARQQVVLPVGLQADQSVTPGPRSATFLVSLNTDAGAAASVAVSLPFTVEVYGESEILKAVGVPLFLVLPGVLIVLTTWFLVTRLSPLRTRAATGDSPTVVQAATGAAALGVAVSLVIALVYPWLTEHVIPGQRRDYLRSYGFLDFYYVFGYSVAIAVLCWLAVLAGYLLRHGYRVLIVPRPGDSPARLLRKLGLLGVFGGGTTFQRVQGAGVALRNGPGAVALVAPRIVATVPDAGPSGPAKATIDDLAANGPAWRLWWVLRRPGARSRVRLRYLAEGGAVVAEVQNPVIDSQLAAIVQVE